MRIVSMIPARGGSKGIPRKNLAVFRGQPLIQYTLDAVAQSSLSGTEILSTDDPEIADYCSVRGLSSSYQRPAWLATDGSPMADTALHLLDWVKEEKGSEPEWLVVLQPTSPLRTPSDIDTFVHVMTRGEHLCVVSAHEVREHPMECVQVQPDGNWKYLMEPPVGARGRQDYGKGALFVNGALFAVRVDFLRATRSFLAPGTDTTFFLMEGSHGLDVDTWEDLHG